MEEFANIKDLKVGMQIQGEDKDSEITQIEVTVDFNHPLAGKDLDYKVKIDSLL